MQRILGKPAVKSKTFISEGEYQARRERLLSKLPHGSMVIIPGEKIHYRNHDSEFLFRQNSDFYYLCGFSEPEAMLVLLKPPKKGTLSQNETTIQNEVLSQYEFIMFCNPNNPKDEVWTGKRIGIEGILADFGAHRAYSIHEVDAIIPELMITMTHCYYPLGQDRPFDEKIFNWVNAARTIAKKGEAIPVCWCDVGSFIHELRVIKSETEIALMQKAAEISVASHLMLMESCSPGKMEYQMEGEFFYECTQHGTRFLAYPSIIASGNNACVLHYTANEKMLNEGELVLVDAGCEYQNYASDITRTYPVNGRFSPEQKQIYELVLKAQQSTIDMIKPGVRWDALQNNILEILTRGLSELKILEGDLEKLIKNKAYLPYYMHGLGHFIGLDVHDPGSYKVNQEWRALESGMVLTVEPGLYIAEKSACDPKWWGIGVRIEDDVVVTDTGHSVLTEKLPKKVADIEAIMKKEQKG